MKTKVVKEGTASDINLTNLVGLLAIAEDKAKELKVKGEVKGAEHVIAKSKFLAKTKMVERIGSALNALDPILFPLKEEFQFVAVVQGFVREHKAVPAMELLLEIDQLEADFKIRNKNFYYLVK